MKLVISGYHGFGNTGDEAILAGMLVTLQRLDPALAVTVLSGDPAETERSHGVEAVGRADVRAIVSALRGSDGLISGGGSLLQDRTSARPVAYYGGITGLARLVRRPYAIHAQGLGPITRRLNRMLAARTLGQAAHVSLRDPASIELARQLGVRRAIDLAPDPALAIEPDIERVPGRIVVAVRDWGHVRAHLLGLREALATLATGRRILALPMQEAADREASSMVVAGVDRAEVVPASASTTDRIAILASAELVIGMRLHALVVAAAAGVPALALSYDPKVDAFASLVGQEIVGSIESPIVPSDVVDAAERALRSPVPGYGKRVAELRNATGSAMARTITALGWRGGSGQLGGR